MNGMTWFRIGAISGFFAVGFGAFGAHGLKETLEKTKLAATFETGAHYHMYHSLALLAVGLGFWLAPGRAWNIAGWCFLAGIVLFSGSLYALALSDIRALGAITPFGGVLFLIGWAALAVAAAPLATKPAAP
jgi:uncharacterized membrane protein YgdD (TMEM256/DUF423 family)